MLACIEPNRRVTGARARFRSVAARVLFAAVFLASSAAPAKLSTLKVARSAAGVSGGSSAQDAPSSMQDVFAVDLEGTDAEEDDALQPLEPGIDAAPISSSDSEHAPVVSDGFHVAEVWRRCRHPYVNQPHGVDSVATVNHGFIYVDNVKAGSSSIRDLLEYRLNVSWGWSDMPHSTQTGLHERTTSKDFAAGDIAKVFRFSVVREPVKKFESGVRQAWRFDKKLRSHSADEILDRLLQAKPLVNRRTGEVDGPNWLNEHLEPSTWRLSSFVGSAPIDLDFIGKVEHIHVDWPVIVENVQNVSDDTRTKLGRLGKSNSKKEDDRSKLSPAAIRRMCQSELFGSEWACFGYELPEACRR